MQIIQNLILYITSFILAVAPMNQYSEGIVGQPRSFFPSQAQTQNDKTISRLIYRGLFKYDIYGTLVPDLADTWEISSDGITYTIKLKDNQYWSDGTKITSDDLIYSAFKIQNLSGVATDKVDSLTVRYTLPNKFSPFLSLLTVGVMKSNSEENDTPLQPISSGPFRIVRVQKSGPVVSSVTLVHNNSAENIRRLNFRYYANQDELTTAAKLGEIEGFISTKKEDLANFSERRFPLEGVYYALFFNLRNPKLKDQLLRQKLQKVLPLHDLTIDLGIPVEGAISRSIFTDKALNFDAYDKLFSEQIPDLTVTLTVPDIPEHVSLANQIKMFWKDKLGINVLINKVDPSKINDQVIKSRNFEVLLYGQEVSLDPDRYINWHSTQADYPGLNLSAFSQVRADRALEEGRNEIDNDKRVVHYNEFQKVMVDQVPAIFLYHPYIKYYVSKYIDGIGEKYTSTLADRFLDFDNWHRIKTN